MVESARIRHALALGGRILVTGLLVIVAVLVARWMWVRYQVEPWTRDGRVRADVAAVAPDVAGFVTRIDVRDNQVVHKGDELFALDQARFQVALQQSLAAIEGDKAALVEAQREARRNDGLGELVSAEIREQSHTRVQQDRAALDQAITARDTAQLNLKRTTILAPVNGMVTNLELRPGDYLTVGRQALALVDSDSLHVDGYFEETKLPRIHVGDPVTIRLMGERTLLHGHVESVAAAIEDRERSPSSNLLANVNPTFSWVRLAQRIPVRVSVDSVPVPVRLIAGRTATVSVLTPDMRHGRHHWWDMPQ
ncbi:HlyD family secretion protein [Caulobacter sp. S45]|uniref:efflux RND transporter periplasmic adaptor subunit n=1 Tax=Caulobacter sp. S45 TaxID=1641861 RepID=UPI00131E7272|nr:HlyD family secretion protein [Caulobacter sp. S45]